MGVEPLGTATPTIGVVIPAHDEERQIGRLLDALLDGARPGELEIVVVCNGCHDRTAEMARHRGNDVTVLEIPEPSKRLALRAGDRVAAALPRIYVDADVVLDIDSVRALAARLRDDDVHAAAPRRVLPRDGVARLVSWYYDVWESLPQVEAGLFGRGVVALDDIGVSRVGALPPSMSDDLVMSEAFALDERAVVSSATVVVRPPKTLRDLLRRRIRVVTGNAEAQRAGLRSDEARTSLRTLGRLAREQPRLIPKVPVFAGVTVAARLSARRRIRQGDFSTWLRDESSRTS